MNLPEPIAVRSPHTDRVYTSESVQISDAVTHGWAPLYSAEQVDAYATAAYAEGRKDAREEWAEVLEALQAIVDLDNGDEPAFWPHAELFARARAAIAAAKEQA